MTVPNAEDFTGKKKLYCVANIYAIEDAPEDYKKLLDKYWDEVIQQIEKIEAAGKVKRIFWELIYEAGEEAFNMLTKINERIPQIIRKKSEEGGVLIPLENKDILGPYTDWGNCLRVVFTREVFKRILEFYTESAEKKMQHIMNLIESKLLEAEAGLLIMKDEDRDPDAPTIATVSPERICRLISSRIVRLPVASCTILPRPSAWIAMLVTPSPALRRAFLVSSAWLLTGLALAAHQSSAHAQPAPATGQAARVLLVLGDSLSAEYGLPRGTGWVHLLSERMRDNRFNYTVVNSSISGETTSGGRTRLPALLKQHRPQIVVLELGANDGLRGLPLSVMRDNLTAMIRAIQDTGAKVLLVGVRVPPNYGRDYSEKFFGTYADLARELRVPLVPFLLEGFADSFELFQTDRIHPAVEAQPRMLDNVWPALRPLLGEPKKR